MNPLTEPFKKWEIGPLDGQGYFLEEEEKEQSGDGEQEAAPQSSARFYNTTAIGINLRDPKSAHVVIEVTTGQGREVDETFARHLLDSLQTKSESDLLLQRAGEYLDRHKQQQHWHSHGPLSDQVPEILSKYEDLAERHMTGVKHWRDDMIVYLRAMAMVCEMVGNAATHAEKAARLRGVIEMIETTLLTLRNEEFNFNRSYWRAPDVFRSDYPVLSFLRRIHDLEAELEEARGDGRKGKRPPRSPEMSGDAHDDSDPFADE